jgi:rod shape-determining protein MreC
LWGINRFVARGSISNFVYSVYRVPGSYVTRRFTQVGRYFKDLFSVAEIRPENDKLKNENIDLLEKTAEIDELRRENESLRNQLNVSSRKKHDLLIADAFGLERSGISSTMIIDKGSTDGVKESMAVVAGGNVLAGVVQEVFSGYSKVRLLDDPRSEISVRIGDSQVVGGAKGLVGAGIFLDFVTNKDLINVGDLIITSGIDKLPESLLVGKISDVDLRGGNLFKKVNANLLFNISMTQKVFVILN